MVAPIVIIAFVAALIGYSQTPNGPANIQKGVNKAQTIVKGN